MDIHFNNEKCLAHINALVCGYFKHLSKLKHVVLNFSQLKILNNDNLVL